MHPYLAGAPPIAMAHRGAHGDGAGENSLEAFAHAVDLGYRYLETDVHRTADGVLVAMHDSTLERTTDGEGPVAQRAWGEIARLQVTGGGRVPSIEELLATWPTVRWNLDCKTADAAPDVLRLVRRQAAFERVCLGSFDQAAVVRMREAAGEQLCTAATRAEVRRLVMAARLPRFARRVGATGLRCDAVQVPVSDGRTPVVTAAFVEVCHAVGLPVHVWTVNDERLMRRLLDLGVDGLITDRAADLRRVLEHRGGWPAVDGRGRRDRGRPAVDRPAGDRTGATGEVPGGGQ